MGGAQSQRLDDGTQTLMAHALEDAAFDQPDVESAKQAAEELSVTATAISHQIRSLEESLGVVLFLLANVFLSEWMNMSIGMLVHEASILVVILNGMRLLRYKLR